jgi:hypothetical protein
MRERELKTRKRGRDNRKKRKVEGHEKGKK